MEMKPSFVLVLATSLAAGGLAAAAEGPEIRIDAERLKVLSGGAPCLDYRHSGPGLFKPCVAGLFLPGGVNPLRDAPFDHLHHHALMLAFNVDGMEFWGVEDANCGRQVHREFAEVKEPREGRVSFIDRLEWQAPAAAASPGKAVLLEDRRVSIRPARSGEAQVLDWESVFRLPPGARSVKLTGREYNGLGARFLVSMDKGGRFLNGDGASGVAGTNGKRARWCAYSASLETGAKVTFALFDDPKNPRSPADWFTMDTPFAYLSLTLGLDAEPLQLEEGKELRLRYGAALLDGEAGKDSLEAAYRAWLDLR